MGVFGFFRGTVKWEGLIGLCADYDSSCVYTNKKWEEQIPMAFK